MEDRTLVELYWARDPRALSETAAKYGTYCREIARNILGSVEDAAECVNDTYLHAWNSIPRLWVSSIINCSTSYPGFFPCVPVMYWLHGSNGES